MERNTLIHFLAGGCAGTTGAVLTCPLEVVKTRLQSSVATFGHAISVQTTSCVSLNTAGGVPFQAGLPTPDRNLMFRGIYMCVRHIKETEGVRGLFKGLGPNLLGVCPSRAFYFLTYKKTKQFLNTHLMPDTAQVHILSAVSGGFVANTLTNPIWFVKTRLQLDQNREGRLRVMNCVKNVYNKGGFLGFYKGITASYFGISETVLYFVTYEYLKEKYTTANHSGEMTGGDFLKFMVASAVAKTFATMVAYPHEVVRTRLRQEGNKYNSFLQTLLLVKKEEGVSALYRGLATQFARQIPNSAIVMVTYEAIVYFFCNNEPG